MCVSQINWLKKNDLIMDSIWYNERDIRHENSLYLLINNIT